MTSGSYHGIRSQPASEGTPMDSMIYKSPDDKPLGTRGELVEKLAGFNTMPEIEGGSVLFGPGISIRFLDTSNHELNHDDDLVQLIDVQCTHDLEAELANLSLERLEENFPRWQRAFETEKNGPDDTANFFDINEFLDE